MSHPPGVNRFFQSNMKNNTLNVSEQRFDFIPAWMTKCGLLPERRVWPVSAVQWGSMCSKSGSSKEEHLESTRLQESTATPTVKKNVKNGKRH